MEVEHGESADEVNLAVITLKVAPKVFIPYFTLVGRTHTINKSNNFRSFFITTFTMISIKVGYAVLLNNSTDGISCETT